MKKTVTRAKLKWHRKTVHATPVNCQCCNKVFKTDALLKNHLKKIFQGKLPILWERISKSTELEKAPSFPWKYRGVQMWWLWKNLTNSGRGIKWLMWRVTNMKTYFNVQLTLSLKTFNKIGLLCTCHFPFLAGHSRAIV